jgi:large subunit ribosomal protein L14
MINVESILKVTDNSGAILVKCIKVLKISKRVGACPGQIITVVVIKNVYKKHVIKKSKMIHRKFIYKALLLQTIKGIKR